LRVKISERNTISCYEGLIKAEFLPLLDQLLGDLNVGFEVKSECLLIIQILTLISSEFEKNFLPLVVTMFNLAAAEFSDISQALILKEAVVQCIGNMAFDSKLLRAAC